MSNWIKLACETMPDIDERVLCLWVDGHHESATLDLDDNGSVWHYLDDGEMLNYNPTHWQPLPEPPTD